MPLLRRLLVVPLLAASLLVLPSSRAMAETSYHKLKKHLRLAERITGGLLEKTGEGLADVVSHVTVDIEIDLAPDEDHSDEKKKSPAAPSKPAAEPTPASSKPRTTSTSSSAAPSPPAKATPPAKAKK
jgi:hypothetical protein